QKPAPPGAPRSPPFGQPGFVPITLRVGYDIRRVHVIVGSGSGWYRAPGGDGTVRFGGDRYRLGHLVVMRTVTVGVPDPAGRAARLPGIAGLLSLPVLVEPAHRVCPRRAA